MRMTRDSSRARIGHPGAVVRQAACVRAPTRFVLPSTAISHACRLFDGHHHDRRPAHPARPARIISHGNTVDPIHRPAATTSCGPVATAGGEQPGGSVTRRERPRCYDHLGLCECRFVFDQPVDGAAGCPIARSLRGKARPGPAPNPHRHRLHSGESCDSPEPQRGRPHRVCGRVGWSSRAIRRARLRDGAAGLPRVFSAGKPAGPVEAVQAQAREVSMPAGETVTNMSPLA